MKKIILLITAIFFANITSFKSQELTKAYLKSEIGKVLKAIEVDIVKYRTTGYPFLVPTKTGSYYPQGATIYMGYSFSKSKTDKVKDFLEKNIDKAVKEYAKENNLGSYPYQDGVETGRTYYNYKTNRDVIRIIRSKYGFGEVHFFSNMVDNSVSKYLGSVTNFCYQSSNAGDTEYAYFQVIDIYAKGNPNLSEDQLIDYARRNTLEQINRRNWRWRGAVKGTPAFASEISGHEALGKRVLYETVSIE